MLRRIGDGWLTLMPVGLLVLTVWYLSRHDIASIDWWTVLIGGGGISVAWLLALRQQAEQRDTAAELARRLERDHGPFER